MFWIPRGGARFNSNRNGNGHCSCYRNPEQAICHVYIDKDGAGGPPQNPKKIKKWQQILVVNAKMFLRPFPFW